MSETNIVNTFLERADPDQRRAIEHPLGGGPAILVAGAGSGKTFTLTGRVAWLISVGVAPYRILAVTFTNKAADELRERIGVADGDPYGPRISTIHSLALAAIRKDPTGFGLQAKISPLDTMDQADMIDDLVAAKFKGPKKDSAFADFNKWGFLEKIGYHRARGLGFSTDYTPLVHEQARKYLKGRMALNEFEVTLWREYEEAKKAASALDFDDMIHLVVRRGLSDEHWAKRLGAMFEHVLVDESQDTSPIQWAFLELLVGDVSDDLFAVGDSGQSIMGFQGAMPEILVGMAKTWRGLSPTVYKLERNYRSVPGIVKLANQIQSNMKDTIPLIMASMREAEEGGCMWMMSGASEREIAAKIAERIALDNRGGAAGLRFKDNAILVRAKSQIGDVESELIRCRVPYVIRGGQGIFQTMEAKDLVAYLRIISNPRDVVAFTRACSVPRRGIGEVGIRALQVQANKGHEGNLILAAVASPNPKMNDFGTFVLQFQNALSAGGYGIVEILNVLIREIGYRELIKARYRDKPEVAEAKLESLVKIVDAIGGIEEAVGHASLEDIVFRLTMDREDEEGTESISGKAVISTIHSSKGLEWERVFVTNVYEGSLPHAFSVTDKEVEEERRLFYVACTRARSRLHICVPNTRQLGPQTRSVQPSRFLDEIRPKRSA